MSYIDRTKVAFGDASGSTKVILTGAVIGFLLPAVLSPYFAFLAAQYYLFALLALSLGLLWGYVGILSFGQAAFFGLGAYIMAWSFQYMFVPGINPAYVALVLAPLVNGAIAGVLGLFLFYSDVKDVYFVIITLALSVILEQLAVSVTSIFGGFNGIYLPRMAVSIPGVFNYQLSNDRLFYYVALLALVGGYYVQAATVTPAAVGLAVVFLAFLSGIKVIDDAQDFDYDRSIDKRTVAVVLGREHAYRAAYALMATGMVAVLALAAASPTVPTSAAAAPVVFGAVAAVARRAGPERATKLLIRGSYLFLAVLVAAVWFRPF